jgi:RNA polymerase sigma factor (sigma-70 family)
MSRIELERPLQAEALREIERSLYGKLKAHRLADSFVERVGEDAVQKGWIEYLRAVREGVEVENRDAFIVQAAFLRAVDELRREARQSDGAALETILESGGLAAPASDELAIEHLAAEELHQAIETLPAEERQALSLHYFEQLSDQRGAEILYCSERTFRRRVEKALRMLGYRLGVPAPEPGSELAIEVGLAAWVSLAGARVVPSGRLLDPLIAAGDTVRGTVASVFDRGREAAARLLTSGASEGIGAAASGPLGKAGGVCAGALAACALTGVIGSGVGGVDLVGGGHAAHPSQHRTARIHRPASPSATRPAPAVPEPAARRQRPAESSPRPAPHATSSTAATRRATHEATSQFGVESAAPESGYSAPAPEASAPSSSASAPSASSPSPTKVANEQFGP